MARNAERKAVTSALTIKTDQVQPIPGGMISVRTVFGADLVTLRVASDSSYPHRFAAELNMTIAAAIDLGERIIRAAKEAETALGKWPT